MMKGYKKAAIGEIPEGWKVVKLGEVTARIGDGIHTTPNYVEASEYFFVNGNNLINGRIKVSEKTKCVSEREFLKHKIELNKGSILLSINGTVGNIAFYKGEKVILGKSAAFINCNEVADKKYIFYQLQSNPVNQYFEFELTGTTIKNLSLKTLRNTPIPYPPLPEQQKIAEILTTVDEKIEVIGEQISQTQELKRGLMQRLLTKGIGHSRFKDSPLGRIPESWVVVQLGEITADMKSGLSRKLSHEDIGLPVIRSNNLEGGRVSFQDLKFWYVDDPQGARTSDYFLKDGDIIINFINSLSQIGKSAIFQNSIERDVIFTTNVLKFTVNNQFNSKYIFYYTQTDGYRTYIDSITKPAVNQASFTTKDLKKMLVPVAPLAEQQKIANIFSTIDEKLEVLQDKKQQYHELKRGLMQQLLTGKVRVTNLLTKAVPA